MKKYSLLFTLMLGMCLNNTLQAQKLPTITECPADSIKGWLKTNKVPAVAIGIIENGKIKSIKVYGETKKGVPARVNTLWNVASLTKPVTALTVLALVNKGEWDLDEPVSKYWIDPDIKDNPWTAKLTTRILLRHSSGFPNWRGNNADKKLNFRFEPGTQMGYSGEGYEYIRRALESKFGKSLQQLANEELFAPLGLKDTRYGWSDTLDPARFAEPHDSNGIRYEYPKVKTVIAADWLITSISDYCKLGLYVINGAGLSPDLYRDMATVHTPFDTTAASKYNGMGLGWQVATNLPNGEYVLTHSGSDDGVKTVIILFPKSKRGIVIFTNGENGDKVKSAILKASKIDLQPALAKCVAGFQ
jgi:CubicO group peptidase (beta-lactamase class C family)